MKTLAIALSAFALLVSPAMAQTGEASWYGAESGTHTANGERWKPMGITAAHRTLPFGTKVKVTCHSTGKSVVVRITDRGPAKWTGRVIDVSHGAAQRLGMVRMGTCKVSLKRIGNSRH